MPIPETLRAAQQAVTQLIDTCKKDTPVYRAQPQAAAQVSRTSKWLLNAIAALERALNRPGGQQSSQPAE